MRPIIKIGDRRPVVRLGLILPLMLSGCTAIDLGDVAPPTLTLIGQCSHTVTRLTEGDNPAIYGLANTSAGSSNFANFSERSVPELQSQITDAKNTLPRRLANDPVVDAIGNIIFAAAIRGQAAGLRAANLTKSAAALDDKAKEFKYPERLKHSDIETFAKLMLAARENGALNATVDLSRSRTAGLGTDIEMPISAYLDAYYQGKYVDLYGSAIAKPSLSTTISDTEIAGLLSVLIDYIADSLHLVPVLGVDASPGATTVLFPGNSKQRPTALELGTVVYQQIPATTDKCAWSGENAFLLGTFANLAGDRAATLSGLVSQSTGGIEVGLGVLGKLSIGDNQTLSILVKTAASRVANRSALALLYWSVERQHQDKL